LVSMPLRNTRLSWTTVLILSPVNAQGNRPRVDRARPIKVSWTVARP
jgi:hypothetical protein